MADPFADIRQRAAATALGETVPDETVAPEGALVALFNRVGVDLGEEDLQEMLQLPPDQFQAALTQATASGMDESELEVPGGGLRRARHGAASRAIKREAKAKKKIFRQDFLRPARRAERAERRTGGGPGETEGIETAPATGLYQAEGDDWVYEVLPDGSYRAKLPGGEWQEISPEVVPDIHDAVKKQIEEGTLVNVLPM